jgi:hypothetical protein
MPFYELRTYEVRPGKMAAWIELFERDILPSQVRLGMVVSAIMHDETGEDIFVWVRRFESEAERVRLYAAVYETPYWRDEITPQVTEMINRDTIHVRRLTPSAASILQ